MSDLPLVIEPETLDDSPDIARLNERVFGPGRFARTAYRIRETAEPDPSLSFVARVGTLLVGANSMTPIAIGGTPALLLGPLIVEPVFRSQGIGEALVTRSLETAQGRGLEARDPGRGRAILWAHGVPACSFRPHHAARAGRSRPPLVLRTPAGGARRRRRPGARGLRPEGEKTLSPRGRKYSILTLRNPIAVSQKSCFFEAEFGEATANPPDEGRAGLDIIEVPPLGRRIEWPTIALAAVIYGWWVLATFFWREFALAGADAGRGLDHRLADEPAARGHPWPSDAGPFCQPGDRDMAAGLWLPFSTYRDDPSASSPGRQSDRPVRGSRKLLLDFGQVARPRPVPPRHGRSAIDPARPDRPGSRLDDLAEPSRPRFGTRGAAGRGDARFSSVIASSASRSWSGSSASAACRSGSMSRASSIPA